ncbi:MAG: hypothetical protein M1824_000203 [Vezdaea acicularis]|nr:MAG: hypothetical protein M1824_000203 [Vezdaea acicularis]
MAATSSPFTRVVVDTMRKLYPEALADKSFDNTGLLLEAPYDPDRKQRNSVLLTIDLTRGVAEEAIRRQDSIIISYHPVIFRGLKSITTANSQQLSLLKLVQEGISVYSPHTAVDAIPAGVNDWLANIIMIDPALAKEEDQSPEELNAIEPAPEVDGFEDAGMGRLLILKKPVPLEVLIERVKHGLGLKALPIAIPFGTKIEDHSIRKVGICAGSGGSLLRGVDADLLFTGELGHHDALAAVESGKVVFAPFHSNTERGYLTVMRNVLRTTLVKEWPRIIEDENLGDESERVHVHVSDRDQEPYIIV